LPEIEAKSRRLMKQLTGLQLNVAESAGAVKHFPVFFSAKKRSATKRSKLVRFFRLTDRILSFKDKKQVQPHQDQNPKTLD